MVCEPVTGNFDSTAIVHVPRSNLASRRRDSGPLVRVGGHGVGRVAGRGRSLVNNRGPHRSGACSGRAR